MGIRTKVILPLTILVLALGVVAFSITRDRLRLLQRESLEQLVASKASEITQSIELGARTALDTAALFSTLPEVTAAYELAASGRMDDENDAKAQEAREMLRRELAPTLAGYAAVNKGQKLQLHFHLPNGRSLVRLWRDKQVKRDDKWVDISDDIASFRPTVVEVNQTGEPVMGIEVGRGGFAIRGVAPVSDGSGKRLGSVETLVELSSILAAASKDKDKTLLLYMNADLLSIAQTLQDKAKYPRVGEKFVLVSGPEDKAVQNAVSVDLLDSGTKALTVDAQTGLALSAFPVKDYKGKQVGVLVYGLDTSAQEAIISDVGLILAGVFAALILLPLTAVGFILSRSVIRPVRRVVEKIKAIAEDRADLTERLDDAQNDEVGELAAWFNRLMGKIEEMICTSEGYMNMVNAVPDPIFAVDDDFRFLMANAAAEKLLGKNSKELTAYRCHDLLDTEACNTENCPIGRAKKVMSSYTADIINIGTEANPHFIQPVGDILKDCYGKHVGYVEVARDVTPMVLKERELNAHMAAVESVNHSAVEIAGQLAQACSDLTGRFGAISSGAERQRDRVTETATAMDQMNATVMEVAKNAGNAATDADAARARAQNGARIVEESVAAIARVREQSQRLKTNMASLGQRADGIGQVLNVISDIADQTNLLALNAAIEAARAGDAGRGFAVVADEVRKLAEKTMTATKEVGEAIRAIQDGARQSLRDVDEAAAAVESATTLAGDSGNALKEIVGLVVHTTDQVQSIATAAEEQSATSEQISRAVSDVSDIAGRTADDIGASEATLQDLAGLADKLRRLVS